MAHFLLFYDLAPDYLTRRTAFRARHLELAWAASERGELVLGGPLGDPVDQALLLFNDAAAAERFEQNDPYVREGVVAAWRVRPWTTVVGETSATPMRPGA